MVLIILFTCIILSTFIISDNFVKNKDVANNLDDFHHNEIKTSQSQNTSWWNPAYKYRKPINISNQHNSDLPKGYSVNISVNTNDLYSHQKLRSDGKDLRIVWYNSSSEAWLELDRVNETNFNTVNTQIWFKTQVSINPNTDDTNYYLYYGNEYADNPPENKSKVYDVYDDFTQSDGDADGWTVISGTWSVINNEYRENSGLTNRRSILDTYTVENASIEVKIKNSGTSFGVGILFRYSDMGNFYCAGIGYWDREIAYANCTGGSWGTPVYDGEDETNLVNDQWYNLKVDTLGSRHKIYLDEELRIDDIDESHLSAAQIGFLTWTNIPSYYDDLKIRLLVETPPILTIGTEEVFRLSLNDFDYFKEIIIDHTKVSGSVDLINFPMLISIFDSDLHDHAQPDGDDIAFYNGTEWLDHEIELFNHEFNQTHAQLVAWVRIPSLSTSTDTKIYMYYGNTTVRSLENPTGVWDTNYVGVWHLSEDPTGTVYDSTARNNDGTSYGSMDSGDQIVGKMDGSINFDGNDDNIATEENNLLAGCSSLTMSAWIKPLSLTQSDFCGIIEYDNTTDGNSFDAAMELRTDRYPRVNVWTTSGFEYVDSSVPLPTTQFTYFVFVYDGDLNIYLDGSFDSSTPHSGNVRNNRRYINIGRNSHDGRSFNGIIDEARISNIDRSADWINTEYNNQYDPNSFYSIGKESRIQLNEDYFNYYKEITIDNTKVAGSSDLYNFPLLISIYDSDLHDHTQSDGDDIAFYDGTKWLDHEIELFNQNFNLTHAHLIAWVRIPTLSTSIDTKIYLYYGNATISLLENPKGVWDDNYVGVWHLSEDPTGIVYDSTTKNNDGTSYGSMNSADQVSGKIDGSLEFDGDDDYIDCGNDSSLDITGDITIEFWVNGESFSNDLDPDILTKGSYTQAYSTWINDDGGVYFQLNGNSLISTSKLSLRNWHMVVCTRSGSNRTIFINGNNDISDSFSTAIETITETLTIARSPDNLNGTLDEIRLSNVARSHDWIATEYDNQNDPDSFYSIGMEESKLDRNANYFGYYKEIIIDHTKVSGSDDLYNFPVLISTFDSDLHDHTQSDGDDIAFYSETKWLDHEIELFNRDFNITHAQLVAWVRIPSLSPSVDTNIIMYYGNSTMSSQECPIGVWDNKYIGVWYLKEDPSVSQIKDSTSNSYHGASYGSMTSNDQVKGQIAGSLEFDGRNDYIDLGSDSALKPVNAFTFEAWYSGIFNTTVNTRSPIYCSGFAWSENIGIRVQAFHSPTERNARIAIGNGINMEYIASDNEINDNIWTHLVGTYDGSTLKLYSSPHHGQNCAYKMRTIIISI